MESGRFPLTSSLALRSVREKPPLPTLFPLQTKKSEQDVKIFVVAHF